ncbi:hypothetical protein AOLI_G00243620 [Acnodon oligacanthus]
MTVAKNETASVCVYYALIPLIESALARGSHCQSLFKTMVTTTGMGPFIQERCHGQARWTYSGKLRCSGVSQREPDHLGSLPRSDSLKVLSPGTAAILKTSALNLSDRLCQSVILHLKVPKCVIKAWDEYKWRTGEIDEGERGGGDVRWLTGGAKLLYHNETLRPEVLG